MALYLIGLGLSNEMDITCKGLDLVKKADKIYLENYTSLLQCSKEDLELFLKKKILFTGREQIEDNSEQLLDEASVKDIALLIVGDPLVATTHIDLFIEAKKRDIPVKVVHNASIVSAISCTGLQLYKFGAVVSIPFQESANSFFDTVFNNKKNGLHSLVLLDLNPIEQKFLTIKEALLRIHKIEQQKRKKVLDDKIICCARVGADNQLITAGSINELQNVSWGKPPYCIVIHGNLHFMEEEAMLLWKTKK